MAPVMRTVMKMKRLKVRKKIREVEIAVKTVKIMKWLDFCLLTLVSFAARCFHPEETKRIMKTLYIRKIPSPKVHTLAN